MSATFEIPLGEGAVPFEGIEEVPFELLLEEWEMRDEEKPDPEHGLCILCDNVWAWWGMDGQGVDTHTDNRQGDVHVVCLKGSRRFRGATDFEEIDVELRPGDRVTFDSYQPHEVLPGKGECILLCIGEEQSEQK